jgi:cell division septation protein DedD
MKRYIPLATILLAILLFLGGGQQHNLAASASVEYLGEGGSYTIDPGKIFIVKRLEPFRFVNEPGPTYDAAPGERVWSSTSSAPIAEYHSWLNFGYMPEGCQISYTAIDDDPDDRINKFYLDGEMIHEMPQGLVTGGQFSLPKSGELTLHAEDSIGMWLDKCDVVETPTPTPEIEITPTETVTPSPTPVIPATPSVPGPTSTKIAPTPTEVVATSTPLPSPTATKEPRLPACFRINFEMSGDSAQEGVYEVREVGGRLLYTWYAQEGWQDSGWVYGIDISFKNVYIEVFFVPEDGPRINMDIMNPSPGTSYGWLSRGQCHALEVGWPDPNITPTPTPDAYDGFNDVFDLEELELQRYIWPEVQPSPTSTPASSLRG